jgi:hypothetical protein
MRGDGGEELEEGEKVGAKEGEREGKREDADA